MRITGIFLTVLFIGALSCAMAVESAQAQFLNDWEGRWLAVSTQFKGLCGGDLTLVSHGKKPKGFLQIMDLVVDQGSVMFTARMFLRVGDQWETTDLLLFPSIGTGRDLVAWFQDPPFQFVSGYIRMVMALNQAGAPAAWAMSTTTGNFSECIAPGVCCAGALQFKGKGVPEEKVPPELR